MSAAIDKPRGGRSPRPPYWGLSGLGWCFANLLALSVGLFPRIILASSQADSAGPPPALRALAVGQVAYLLLVYPLVLLARAGRGERAEPPQSSSPLALRAVAPEWLLWLLTALPFLAVGAYLADGTAADAVRVALLSALLLPTAWALARLARRGGTTMSLVLLLVVLAVLGGPAAWYLAVEFAPSPPPAWLWYAWPAALAWSAGAARADAWLPQPLWAWLLWPGVGLAVLCLDMLLPAPRAQPGRELF